MRRIIAGTVLLPALLAAPPVAAQGFDPDRGGFTTGEEEPLPYRGTTIIYENALSALTFDRSAELYYNPKYVMTWTFRPRYYLYDSLSLRLDFSVETELTNSDWTQTRYEPILSDTSLGAVYADFYEIPVAEIKITGGVWFGFPSSKASQAQSMYASLAPTFTLRRVFDVLSGLEISYTFRYTKYLNEYTTLMAEDEVYPCPLNIEDRSSCFAMGPRNPSMTFRNSFAINQYFTDKLYATLDVRVYNTLLYDLSPAVVETMAGPVVVPESPDNTDHQGMMRYTFEIGYDAAEYVSVAAGFDTYNPQLDEGGGIRTPFVNRYTNIYLDVVLSVDGLVNTITGSGQSEADVAASENGGAVAARW